MSKLLMIIFTENANIGASILCSESIQHGWKTDIYFVPPNITSEYTNLKSFINSYKPDLISFSFKSFERNQSLSVAKEIKDIIPITTKIIAGGIHPSLMPCDISNSKLFDAIIVGDGLGIWKDILDSYTNFNNHIIYGESHKDKSLYTKHFYSSNQIETMKNTKTATIITAIGCPYKCSFCHSGNQKYFPFSIEDVAEHIIDLYKNYGVTNFHFLDDLFTSNIKRLRKLREIITENHNITISSQVSAKANIFNQEIAEELIKLSVETVNIGIETGSPRLLKFLNKKQTIEDCYRAVKICHDIGLNCVINLMFGIPTETEEDYTKTLDFVRNSKPDSINCFFYTPYPGTELYNYCFENNYLPKSFNKSKFDWFEPKTNGASDIQIRLNKVDYYLAQEYINKIHKELNQDQYIVNRLKLIDLHPWILIGSSRHYYYNTILKKISQYQWNNFYGYININKNCGFQIDTNLHEYDNIAQPIWAATYSFIGSDFKILQSYIKDHLNNIPLISISSFKKSHSNKDINRFMRLLK